MSDLSFEANPEAAIAAQDVISEALQTMREHLAMDAAYVSELVGNTWIVHSADAPGLEHVIRAGMARPIEDVYCRKIQSGELPDLMPDALGHPIAGKMPFTQELGIGAHISIPLFKSNGAHFGNFCCFSRKAEPSLNPRDLSVMKIFSNMVQAEVQIALETHQDVEEAKTRIMSVMEDKAFFMVFQPIHSLQNGEVLGFEALCRFQPEPFRSPDMWFNEASYVGLGKDLEYRVLENTLKSLPLIPSHMKLSVNAGPDLVASGKLKALFARHDAKRIILEVTEHVEVSDYDALIDALVELRTLGVEIAVDDAGAGFSGLRHLVRLRPEIIKLDRSLVTDIDTDPARRTLCAALVHYTNEAGCQLVAEGVETAAEAAALKELGVEKAQGWLMGRPMALADALIHAKTCAPGHDKLTA